MRERLAALDELLADGVIDANEHAHQRTRILDELYRRHCALSR